MQQTNLVSFYDSMTCLVDEGKAVNVVYLTFTKIFGNVSNNILLKKLAAAGLNRSTLHWMMDQGDHCPELEDHDCGNDELLVNSEILWDLLLQLDPYKSVRPDRIHPRILKELDGVISKSLSIIFEQSWESREVPANWKLTNVVLIFKKGK
ncbi:hypothetical protein BTVI_42790 [Pitangus sulphuratus]|nr:hypothetical protein BTVI_42790 [Pitangus sulphuratus]